MKNKKALEFLDKIKKNNSELLNRGPRFKKGDIIINEKFKVVSIVTNIANTFPIARDCYGSVRGTGPSEVPHYILKDLENKTASEYFSKNNMTLDKNKRRRWKEVKKIDIFYKLVDPVKAQLLYGSEIIDLKKKYGNESNNKR